MHFDKTTKNEVIKFYEAVLNEELIERAMVKSHFQEKEDYEKNVIKPFKPEDLRTHDNIECYYCINLCYCKLLVQEWSNKWF